GLLLDLGGDQQVSQVQVTVRGGETAAQVYLSDGEPSSLEGLEPVGAAAGDGVLTISFDAPANATHVVVWLTRIPGGAGAFRGEIPGIEGFGWPRPIPPTAPSSPATGPVTPQPSGCSSPDTATGCGPWRCARRGTPRTRPMPCRRR